MSRCKCGNRLSKAELTYKDPTTDQYLDMCFACRDSYSVEEDILVTECYHLPEGEKFNEDEHSPAPEDNEELS